jgi:hypothetical protein
MGIAWGERRPDCELTAEILAGGNVTKAAYGSTGQLGHPVNIGDRV